jgi:Flp pilus assembly protein TadD
MLNRLLRAAFSSKPTAQSLIEEGLALRRAGRLRDAERALRAAVAAYPLDATAATNLGIVLLEQDRGQEGVDWLQQALEHDCALSGGDE